MPWTVDQMDGFMDEGPVLNDVSRILLVAWVEIEVDRGGYGVEPGIAEENASLGYPPTTPFTQMLCPESQADNIGVV